MSSVYTNNHPSANQDINTMDQPTSNDASPDLDTSSSTGTTNLPSEEQIASPENPGSSIESTSAAGDITIDDVRVSSNTESTSYLGSQVSNLHLESSSSSSHVEESEARLNNINSLGRDNDQERPTGTGSAAETTPDTSSTFISFPPRTSSRNRQNSHSNQQNSPTPNPNTPSARGLRLYPHNRIETGGQESSRHARHFIDGSSSTPIAQDDSGAAGYTRNFSDRPLLDNNRLISRTIDNRYTRYPTTPLQEFGLPRWQPDAEATYCPICQAQFSFFVRKHHCRKCGRVVCNSCSPHRIIIPHQYIVRAPGSEFSLTPNLIADGLGAGYMDINGISGGERVRLCNPCVPDPNTEPPQSPISPQQLHRASHRRARSSLSGTSGNLSPRGQNVVLSDADVDSEDSWSQSSRSRSVTMNLQGQRTSTLPPNANLTSLSYQTSRDRFIAAVAAQSAAYRSRHNILGEASSSRQQRALPPTPQIAEEDECPVCHRELPSQSLPDFEVLREAHINNCILTHSQYGSPRPVVEGTPVPVVPRRTGMYTYAATEKDCVDDAECTICLEEFETGVPMARLECLCRFHRKCIALWFVNHPGRCPVHQHDGFGY